MEELIVKIDGKEYKVKVEETPQGTLKIYCDGNIYEVEARPVVRDIPIEQTNIDSEDKLIKASIPGIIVDVKVNVGQEVHVGQPLIKLIAMKMENEITAPRNGIVAKINVKKNDNVNRGDILLVLE